MATLQQITTRAKQLRKNYPSAKWTDLIKTASLELKRNPVRVKSMIKEVAIKKFGSIAGLPDNFTFSFGDSKFYVQKQFNMYGLVDLVIYDKKTDEAIVILDGKNKETAINRLNSHIRSQQQTRSGEKWTSKDMDDMGYTKAIKKLIQELTTEVKKYNVAHKPSKKVVVKKVAVKKSAPRKSVAKKSAPKKTTKQSGRSNEFWDSLHQAKKPGKRTTAWGTTYYENRANRSDKGVLLGMKKGSTHKDTKSHNVRISVMSGMNNYVKELKFLLDKKEKLERDLSILRDRKKHYPIKNWDAFNKHLLKRIPILLKHTNKQITEIKKLIK